MTTRVPSPGRESNSNSLERRRAQTAIYVQSWANTWERNSELHERDGHGRLHPDSDRLGVEDARHPCDVSQHAADERIDDVERGDIDQDAAGAVAHDAIREVV